MPTVFEALVAIAERLPKASRGIATGGGFATYLYLDDLARMTLYENDVWIGGTLLIETGACEGAVLAVQDSVQATGRLLGLQQVWSRTASETPAAGDMYVVTPQVFHTGLLITSLLEALRSWGDVITRETLGTGDGQTTSWTVTTDGDVVRVLVTNEDGDQRWESALWERTSTGIEMTFPPSNGHTVVAWVRHSAATAMVLPVATATLDDDLPADIPLEYLGWYGAYVALRSTIGAPGMDRDTMVQLMNYYAEQGDLARTKTRHEATGRERFMV